MHLNSELLFKKYFKDYFKSGIKVLEIGPAGIPSIYSKLIGNDNIQWDTIDFSDTGYIDSQPSNLTFFLKDPYSFPIEDNSYDIVLSGQVIEHVQEIWNWLRELKRITKPQGLIMTINPVSWPYHEAPIDCWRIYPSGMEGLAKYCDLSLELCKCESLELDLLKSKFTKFKAVPGKSFNYENSEKEIGRLAIISKILSWMRIDFTVPIEVAYDTVSVLRKK
jgi:ubiquinone/menaquinone biosynthesis C-methylase UbiE